MSFSKNMPSAHMLMPSKRYFTDSDSTNIQKNIIRLDNWTKSHSGIQFSVIDSFNGMSDVFKKISSINSTVFNSAESEHDSIDSFSPDLSTKTYSIIGVGIPTLSAIDYVKPRCRGFFFCTQNSTPDFNREYSLMGDGVVIAHNLSARTGSVFVVDVGRENEERKTNPNYFKETPISHQDIFRSSGVSDVLHGILSADKKQVNSEKSFADMSNKYVSYISSVSKSEPIKDPAILSGITKMAGNASDSGFIERFNQTNIFTTEAYGPITLVSNFRQISDLQNKPIDQLNMNNVVVNKTNYKDDNRVGVASAVSCDYFNCINVNQGQSQPSSSIPAIIFGQGSKIGTAQLVTHINNQEMVYPIISVTPSTNLNIDYSTTTISIDNNSDGVIDKIIKPIQIKSATSTEDLVYASSSEPIDDAFSVAKNKIQDFINNSQSSSTSSVFLSASSSSIYLANKYMDKINIVQRKYNQAGLYQSIKLINQFYSSLERNMKTISDIILTYNKEQGFYLLNNFVNTNSRVLFLTQRQKDMRQEMLAYIEIHDAFSELVQKLGEGL